MTTLGTGISLGVLEYTVAWEVKCGLRGQVWQQMRWRGEQEDKLGHKSVHHTRTWIPFTGQLREAVGFSCFCRPGKAATVSKDQRVEYI